MTAEYSKTSCQWGIW